MKYHIDTLQYINESEVFSWKRLEYFGIFYKNKYSA